MSTTIIVAAVLGILALAVMLWTRRANGDDPGAVSHRWIAEHRAQHPQDGSRSHW